MKRRSVLLGGAAVAVVGTAGAALAYDRSLYAPRTTRRGTLALTGATVLAGESLAAMPDATVLVEDGAITAVGPRGAVGVPGGVTVLDVAGLTVMPGLIDLHVHLGSPDLAARQEPGPRDMPRLILDTMRFAPGHRRNALAHGVTAVRSLGDDSAWIMDLRRQIDDGTLEGPRVFAAGPLFTTPGGHPVVTFGADPASDLVRLPASPDEARRMVRDLAAPGPGRVDVVKVVQERGSPGRALEPIPPAILTAIVAEAHAAGLAVVAHWGTLTDLGELIEADVDELQHIDARDLLGGWPVDTLAELVRRQIPLTPTLVISEAALPPAVMPEAMRQFRRRVGEFHAAGGSVLVGTDAARPGVHFGSGVHRELELLVECGLTPRQALRAATVDAARALGAAATIGAVAEHRAADLVVVDGDPTTDVAACRRVVLVLRDGRLVVDRRSDRQKG